MLVLFLFVFVFCLNFFPTFERLIVTNFFGPLIFLPPPSLVPRKAKLCCCYCCSCFLLLLFFDFDWHCVLYSLSCCLFFLFYLLLSWFKFAAGTRYKPASHNGPPNRQIVWSIFWRHMFQKLSFLNPFSLWCPLADPQTCTFYQNGVPYLTRTPPPKIQTYIEYSVRPGILEYV